MNAPPFKAPLRHGMEKRGRILHVNPFFYSVLEGFFRLQKNFVSRPAFNDPLLSLLSVALYPENDISSTQHNMV